MKALWRLFCLCLGLVLLAFLFEGGKELGWHFKVLPPPSLDSWDPAERVEAARDLVKKYGGKPCGTQSDGTRRPCWLPPW